MLSTTIIPLPFPAVCTVHSAQPSQRGELWDSETDLVKSTFLILQCPIQMWYIFLILQWFKFWIQMCRHIHSTIFISLCLRYDCQQIWCVLYFLLLCLIMEESYQYCVKVQIALQPSRQPYVYPHRPEVGINNVKYQFSGKPSTWRRWSKFFDQLVDRLIFRTISLLFILYFRLSSTFSASARCLRLLAQELWGIFW